MGDDIFKVNTIWKKPLMTIEVDINKAFDTARRQELKRFVDVLDLKTSDLKIIMQLVKEKYDILD